MQHWLHNHNANMISKSGTLGTYTPQLHPTALKQIPPQLQLSTLTVLLLA